VSDLAWSYYDPRPRLRTAEIADLIVGDADGDDPAGDLGDE
jgi:hypothetical protein